MASGSNAEQLSKSLRHGQLIDHLHGYIEASHFVVDTDIEGSIPSLVNSIEGDEIDGIGRQNLATDKPTDYDVVSSLMAGEPMSYKREGTDSPAKIHLVVDWANRYRNLGVSATSLDTLARFTTAMTCLVAQYTGSKLDIVVSGKNPKPKLITEPIYSNSQSKVQSMVVYDSFIKTKPEPLKEDEEPADLRDSLFTAKRQVNLDNDIVIVASDFVDGAVIKEQTKKDKEKGVEVLDFTWKSTLQGLHAVMKDRLLVVRFTTSGHTRLQPGAVISDDKRVYPRLSFKGYMEAARAYNALGSAKAEKIAEILRPMRHIDLDTDSTRLVEQLAKFMLGSA